MTFQDCLLFAFFWTGKAVRDNVARLVAEKVKAFLSSAKAREYLSTSRIGLTSRSSVLYIHSSLLRIGVRRRRPNVFAGLLGQKQVVMNENATHTIIYDILYIFHGPEHVFS